VAKGFLCTLSNPAFPGLVKIGWSRKVPTDRAEELFTTGVPAPFEVEYYCLTEGREDLKARIHEALAQHRYSEDREFFRISIVEARAAIERHCTPEHVWSAKTASQPAPNQEMECPKCRSNFLGRTSCLYCSTKLVPRPARAGR